MQSHCVNLFALASNARQDGSRGLSWDPGIARVANGQSGFQDLPTAAIVIDPSFRRAPMAEATYGGVAGALPYKAALAVPPGRSRRCANARL